MPDRLFTVAEANELLAASIRALAEEMVRRRAAIVDAEQARGVLVGRAAGNGAGLDPHELGSLDDRLAEEREALAHCVLQIQKEGVQVKDLETGLLDFPAQIDGEDVLLCWRVGEPEIAWYHGPEDGFAGRRPLATPP